MNATSDYYVYALTYPCGEIFYIGKGRGDRAERHLKYRIHNNYVAHVIAQIREEELEPMVKKIRESLTNEEACELEKQLISEYGYRITGGSLCNLHPGGQGGRPKEVWTEEQRNKISLSKLGKKLSEETRRKMSEHMLGNTRLLGHKHSEETRLKISTSSKGRKLSEEAIENIRNAKLGDKNPMYGKPSPRRGVTLSEETKRKLSEAAKRRNNKC